MSALIPQLFQPAKLGKLELKHRVVLAPLTRMRANTDHVPSHLAPEYYGQRASMPGTFLLTEATFISPQSGGYSNAPGAYTDEQLRQWKKVTDAVHQNGSFIYLQMWALGRAAIEDELKSDDPNFDVVAPSNIGIKGHVVPRPLTKEEIDQYVDWYATVASDAVSKAGFDGVEIHNANGYLLDQFLQNVSNKRTDEYGGSVQNRSRFVLCVIEAVTKAIGQDRTGIRFSPWEQFQEMRMDDTSIRETYSWLVAHIRNEYPDFAYIHLIEPPILRGQTAPAPGESNDFIRKIWGSRPLISAGTYTRESALKVAESTGEFIAFGRYFLANPDLPKSLIENLPLNQYDRSSFYLKGETTGKGYTDYPFYKSVAKPVFQADWQTPSHPLLGLFA